MDIIFISLFFLISVILLILLEKTGFSMLQVGLVQFVVTALFIFSFVGTLPLYFGWDKYRNESVTDQVIVLKIMLFSGFTLFLFVFGALFAKAFLNAPSVTININRIKVNKTELWISLVLLTLAFCALVIYVSQIPRIALLAVIYDGITESKIARSTMGNDFVGKYHWYSIFMHDIAMIISFTLFSFYLFTKKKFYLIIFTFSFLISTFSTLMTTEKAPFAWFLIGIYLIYVLVVDKGFYQLKKIVVFFFTLISVILLSYVAFMGVNDLGKGVLHIFSRALSGSIQPAYYYLLYFPAHHDFLLGSSFPNPAGILPHQPFALSKEIMEWVKPSLMQQGIVGSMPTVFWGEAYANFGYFGLAFIPFLLGSIVYTVDFSIKRIILSPLGLGFYVWVLLHYKSLAETNFSSFIIDVKFLFILTIFMVSIGISNNLKLRYITRLRFKF